MPGRIFSIRICGEVFEAFSAFDWQFRPLRREVVAEKLKGHYQVAHLTDGAVLI